jgi:hypothetical protein
VTWLSYRLELAVRSLIDDWGEGRISGDRAMLLLTVLLESDERRRPTPKNERD